MKKEKKEKVELDPYMEELAKGLQAGKPLIGEGGIFTPLLKRLLEASLDGELEAHLSETRDESKNRKNGRMGKTVQSSVGDFELLAPRDRNGTFDPQLVKKRQHRISSDIDRQILSLYAMGLSYRDIQQHLQQIYGVELSTGAITAITDHVLPAIKDWQNRALDDLYPVIWMDAMFFKVREEGRVISKSVYSVLGVTCDGEKQVLGIYIGDAESSTFWRQVLHDLQIRGVRDILIACIDNLTGLADVIQDMYPATDVQLCLVHQMRNSSKYITNKDLKPMMQDLKKIYQATNTEAALFQLHAAEAKWGKKYAIVFKSWHRNWDNLTSFFRYPVALRKVIYTTNPIESYHRMVRKVTKTKGAFTSEDAVLKQIYLAIINAQTKWSGTMFAWSIVRRELTENFGDRFSNADTVN
ncbi:MAG: IS256 family transposase [Chitinophagales bacterium]